MLRGMRRVFALLVGTVEISLRLSAGLVGLAWSALLALIDFGRSRRALGGGTFRCPVGHEISTEGDTYECGACGYQYGGASASTWECGNVECKAITPYVSCPTCGLSCRNPYRWGRP